MADSFKVTRGSDPALILSRKDITTLGEGLNLLIASSTGKSGFKEITSRSIAFELAACALGCQSEENLFTNEENNLPNEPRLIFESDQIHIDDKDTLMDYVTSLLESIANSTKESKEALTWFLDGLIQSNVTDENILTFRNETQALTQEFLDKHKEIFESLKTDIIVDDPPSGHPQHGTAGIEFSEMLAFAPSMISRLHRDKAMVTFTLGEDSSFAEIYDVVLADLGDWTIATNSRYGEKERIRASITKDSVAGRILQDIYGHATGGK